MATGANQCGDDAGRAETPRPLARKPPGNKARAILCCLLAVLACVVYWRRQTPAFQEVTVRCLGMIGSRAAPRLVGYVRDAADLRVYALAVMELRGMKRAASPALLGALLEENDPAKRSALAYALHMVGWQDTDIPRVVHALSDADPGVRRRAAWLLPRLSGANRTRGTPDAGRHRGEDASWRVPWGKRLP